MGHRYVVFGAGRQGTAAIHDLVAHCEADLVVAVEPDKKRARMAKVRLSDVLGKRAQRVRVVASIADAELARADVVLSCAPYQANVALTRRSLAAGVAFCDLGGNPDTVRAQQALAKKSRTPVVPECGVSPGLSNILAVHCARVHGCDVVRVRCGGLPLVCPDPDTNPLGYKLVFSPWGLISEYSGDVPVVRKGKVERVGALSVIEPLGSAPEDADLECSPTSNNSPQVVEYLARSGVREYDYMTVRYTGHWSLVRGWKTLGYLAGDEERDRELAKRLESDPILRYDPDLDRDRLILRVQGSNSRAKLRRSFGYALDVAADQRTRFAAMELTTCWGITIVAHHMASGRGSPAGFATPERFVDGAWVMAELERRLASIRA